MFYYQASGLDGGGESREKNIWIQVVTIKNLFFKTQKSMKKSLLETFPYEASQKFSDEKNKSRSASGTAG